MVVVLMMMMMLADGRPRVVRAGQPKTVVRVERSWLPVLVVEEGSGSVLVERCPGSLRRRVAREERVRGGGGLRRC